MSLGALQHAFQAYVLYGLDGVAERVAPGRLSDHRRRLAIYYDAYRLRLVEALGADFDALIAVMGKQEFERACHAYVEATPSAFRNVRWYGGALATFLRRTRPWCERPWLADIAHFEWTLTLAFDAADAPSVRFEDVAALPGDAWGTLAFRLQPSVRMIALRANAPAIRRAVDTGTPVPEPVLADEATMWLIWRKDFSVHFRSVSDPEAWALRSALDGESFSAICEGLCERLTPETAAGAAAGWLRSWVDDRLIAALLSV